MNETKNGRFIGFGRLKQAVSMEQVLTRYGLLERLRRNGENLTGVCPLHQGHNPTQFNVSLTKNCWICFGDCHAGGSIIDFVSRMESVSIREAALLLQDWFNLGAANGRENAGPKIIPHPSLEGRTLPAKRSANPPLQFSLGVLDGAHPYLKERGLLPETISTFGVGCCAHGSLRGWIAIPIHDGKGRLIAYAGRWPGVPPDRRPKYRLPRGFGKSLELFNQHRAKSAEGGEPLVVVEGFFGCMRVWQAGHRRVVSLMGSILSRTQEDGIVELAGQAGHVLLVFDGDAAGRKGQAEAKERLSKQVLVSEIRLHDGQQPDSLETGKLLELIQPQPSEGEAA
jgi:DNA primase